MAKNKLTQKEAIFYTLWKAHKADVTPYIPVFKFMGEVYCDILGLWGFVSHECSARCSELKKANPNLIQSEVIVGKSGAQYFGYRLKPDCKMSDIDDPKLLDFYKRLKLSE